jgi:outer membrane lipoprotein SlyB
VEKPQRGSILPLLALGLAGLMLVAILLGGLTRSLVSRARAQSAADAVALAGVVEGEAAAAELARRNGATLISFERDGVMVVVVVEVGGVRADAAAELDLDLGAPACPACRAAST